MKIYHVEADAETGERIAPGFRGGRGEPPSLPNSDAFAMIEQCGKALYGANWRAALAEDLEISPRAFRNWEQGRNPVPDGVLEDLLALVGEREKDLCGISGELRQWLSAHARCGEAGIARGAESQVIRAHGSAC